MGNEIRRIPPHDDGAEKSLLGSCLINADILPNIAEIVKREDFYSPTLGIIFETMLELITDGKALDVVTLQSKLSEKGLPEESRDKVFLGELIDTVPTSSNAISYAEIIKEKSDLRKLIKASEQTMLDCYRGSEQCSSILERAEQEIQTISNDRIMRGMNGGNVKIFSDLIDAQIDQPAYAVQGLIPVGLVILAAPPKFGKSWLCLQLGIAMQRGEKFLGFQANRGDVLYLALEDSEARLQDRLRKLGASRDDLKGFAYCVNAPDLDHGLMEELRRILKSRPETRLIVIDTLQKIRGEQKKGDGAYDRDYREVGTLQSFALEQNLSILLVHHTRKMADPSDPFANINGTNGITGGADALLVITRKNRMDKEATLSTTGRDIDAEEIQLNFDNCRWIRLGLKAEVDAAREQEEFLTDPIVQTVMKYLESETEWKAFATEIIEQSKEYEISVNDTPYSVSKKISQWGAKFLGIGIVHTVLNNGKGSKKHRFVKVSTQ